MKISISTFGKFHLFELARQLEQSQDLLNIYSSYPWFALRGEGVERRKIRTHPYVHPIIIGKWRMGWHQPRVDSELNWLLTKTFGRFVAKGLRASPPSVFVGISGSGFEGGGVAHESGALYVCDRGSTHIRSADEELAAEFTRWGLTFPRIDKRFIEREESEYALADMVTVPSEFAKRTFLAKGVPAHKISKVPYGVNLSRFYPDGSPEDSSFNVLFVGSVSLRKGVPYLLEAFRKFRHPKKKLTIVGAMQPEMKRLLMSQHLEAVRFVGTKSQDEVRMLMSTSHVLVLPSIEEGLALVQGQSLACGCPVIGTFNSGAEDLFDDGIEGFIVQPREPAQITERLNNLANDLSLRQRMSSAGLERVKSLGGWEVYGRLFREACTRRLARA